MTLFDKIKLHKIFLAALVLIYFDLSYSAYFGIDGLDLARQRMEVSSIESTSTSGSVLQTFALSWEDISDQASDV